jgi:hypothetical protein
MIIKKKFEKPYFKIETTSDLNYTFLLLSLTYKSYISKLINFFQLVLEILNFYLKKRTIGNINF